MMAGDARKLLLRLLAADTAARLGARARSWLAAALAVYGAAVLASVVVPYPPVVFHGLVLSALGLLPVFLFAPAPGDPGMELVRAVDREAAIEAWLSGGHGAARAILERRAAEAIRVASLSGRPRRRSGRTSVALAAGGLACLILAQPLSLRSGLGWSLSYADRLVARTAQRDNGAGADPQAVLELRNDDSSRQDSGALMRERDYPAAELEPLTLDGGSLGLGPARSRVPGNEPAAPELPAERDGQTGDGTSSGGGASGGAPGAPDESGQGQSSLPGWEGSSRSLIPSPLLDYRAAFQREFALGTGKDAALGDTAPPLAFEGALRDYYGSFDLKVSLDPAGDPVFDALKGAWLGAAP